MRFTIKHNHGKISFNIAQYGKYKVPERMKQADRTKLLRRMVKETIKDGLRAGGAGKFIDVDKDVVIRNGVITIKNIDMLDYNPVSISTRGMSPFEIGRLTAENIFRGNDSDPEIRHKKVYKHQVFDDRKILDWVLRVKLPSNPVEWQQINSMYGDDYDRALNKIVNSIIFASIYPKNDEREWKKEREEETKQMQEDEDPFV